MNGSGSDSPVCARAFLVVLATLSLLLWSGCGGTERKPGAASSGFDAVPLPAVLTEEETDLVVEGAIRRPETVRLDMKTIMRFPRESFTSGDPWVEGRRRYTGIPLYGLLEAIGVAEDATAVRVVAANGYEADIRLEDLERNGYLLAYMINGELTSKAPSLRKRGKLFIALNLEEGGELEPEMYKHQLVWQVTRMVVY